MFGKIVRTNNLHERWNREFGSKVERKITLDNFLETVQRFEALATLRYGNFVKHPPRKKGYFTKKTCLYEEIMQHQRLKKKKKDELEKEKKIQKSFTLMKNEQISTYEYLSKIVLIYDEFKHQRNKRKSKNEE